MARASRATRPSGLKFIQNLRINLEASVSKTDRYSVIGRLNRWLAKFSFSFKMKRSLYRRLGTKVATGKSPLRALEELYLHASDDGRKPNEEEAVIISSWMTNLAAGQGFGTAFKQWIKRDEVALLDAGAKSGNIPKTLENAVFIQESRRQLKVQLRNSLASPFLIAVGIIAIMLTFKLYFLPEVNAGLGGTPPAWTGIGGVFVDMANGFYDILPLFVIAVIVSGFALSYSMSRWTGKWRVFFDRYPPFSFYRLFVGANFLISIGSLIVAGVPVTEALRDLMKNNVNPYFNQRISQTLKHVLRGEDLGTALNLTGLEFPDKATILDLRSYAQDAALDTRIDQLAKENVTESIEKIGVQAKIVQNALLVVGVLFLVGFTVAFTGLQQQFAAAAGN